MIEFNMTKEDIQKAITEGQARRRELLDQPATAVSRETYDEMLEILPPLIYRNNLSDGIRYFVMCEFEYSDVTRCYAMRENDGVIECISKWVTAEEQSDVRDSNITDNPPEHADFDAIQDDIDAITSVESQIYGAENRHMLHACGYIKENYLSGTEATMLRAFEVIEETGCLYLGSAADIAYEYLEGSIDKPTLDWVQTYFDDERYLEDLGFVEISYQLWINTEAVR